MTKQQMKRPRPARSVFQTITIPLLLLLLLEAAFLLCGIHLAGVIRQLDANADRMLAQQVENRKNYLQSEMVSNWSELTSLSDELNAAAAELIASGGMDLDALAEGQGGGDAFLTAVAPQLVSTLYAKRVSGIFLILNTEDLSGRAAGDGAGWPGICIRDMDPLSPQSYRSSDLLVERAPIAVVRSLSLSTDGAWTPLYRFEDAAGWASFFQPFQAAYDSGGGLSAENCTYWSRTPYILPGTEMSAVSCSVPLILDDGRVYGVLGVELLTDFLSGQMPYQELFDGGAGTYFLAVGDGAQCAPVLAAGPLADRLPDVLTLEPEETGPGADFLCGGVSCHAAVSKLTLYNSNTPFSGQRWMLVGAVDESHLYAFSQNVLFLLIIVVAVMLLLAMLISVLIGRQLTAPIRKLAERVDEAQRTRAGIPDLPVTGISEIDRFSAAIITLSRDVTESSTRFLRIMELASVQLGGFEVQKDGETVFITENLFPLFGLEAPAAGIIPLERFEELFHRLTPFLVSKGPRENSWLYRIELSGGVRYLMVQVNRDAGCTVGVAEDVTTATLERLRIEHDRDYDVLTGLYNRRAFYRAIETLFQTPEKLGCAALLMLDLDNLKGINDRYGHDLGDQYIRRAGLSLARAVPEGALCSRISGDEFYIFFSGFSGKDEIRSGIDAVLEAVRRAYIFLPSGKKRHLRISGGVAWYPDDSTDYDHLMKYADFAMYQIKRGHKNDVGEFDMDLYNLENSFAQRRKEFHHLVEQGLLTYHFQPIVDARTGAVRAYEALMRVDLPTLKTPEQVLTVARDEGRLADIERLTWFRATEAFQSLLERGAAERGAMLFVNSIASQHMTDEETLLYHQRFAALQPQVVVEIVEEDGMDAEAVQKKRDAPGFSGMFALDDYGSGYNSEKNLLALEPKFIKIDISIIRGIDADKDKRQIVSNIVAYAHQRDMLVIAEGVETMDELAAVLSLEADLLQGFGLARTGAEPPPVDPAALQMIRRLRDRDGTGEADER